MKNWFVIFPPGSGGNHLANLLSLSEGFEQRFNSITYTHGDKHAHIHTGNIDLNQFDNLELLQNKNNIFCLHLFEYLELKRQSYFEILTNQTFFLMQFPTFGSLGCQRMETHAGVNFSRWLYHDASMLYNISVFKSICDEPSSKCYHIDCNKLFSNNIKLVFDDLQNVGFPITLDLTVAQDLHNKWLEKLFPKESN